MHGLGNDFAIMNYLDGEVSLSVDEPFVFIDTAGCGFDEELKDGSRFNIGEINLVH